MVGRGVGGTGSIDAIDWRIIELLGANARLPFAEIARQVGLSSPAVHERVGDVRQDERENERRQERTRHAQEPEKGEDTERHDHPPVQVGAEERSQEVDEGQEEDDRGQDRKNRPHEDGQQERPGQE